MKIKIKRKNKQVIVEAAMSPADLPKNYYIEIYDGGSFIEVSYKLSYLDKTSPRISGELVSEKMQSGFCLDNTYEIITAKATKKWGPMLYDVMLEYVTNSKGGQLTSDRGMVTTDAKNVWNYYLENRADVEKIKLDLHLDTMNNVYGPESYWPDEFKDEEGNLKKRTPQAGDDCIQDTSIFWAVGKGDWKKFTSDKAIETAVDNPKTAAKWTEQSVSYAYKKSNKEVITALMLNQQLKRGKGS